MKNKKKSLNPTKFWLYQGYLPKLQIVNWNYNFSYKTLNQITLFMENLTSRNFNLLLKKLKFQKYKYQKYSSLFIFNQVFFIFIKLLISKFHDKKFFLKFLLFYLKYLTSYMLIKKLNIKSIKITIARKKKKKRIKEHYLRAIPRLFKDFFFIKQQNICLNNNYFFNIYCLTTIIRKTKNFFNKSNKTDSRVVSAYFSQQVKNKYFLKYIYKDFYLDCFYLNKINISLKKNNQIKKPFRNWIRNRLFLLFVILLKKNQ